MRQPVYGTLPKKGVRSGHRRQGETREEALAMAAGAIERYLEVMAEDGLPIRPVERGRAAVTA